MLHGAVWVGASLQVAFNVCFFGARVWSLDALQPVLPFDFLARATARCFCHSAFGRPFVLLLGLFNTRLLACMLSTLLHFSTPLLPHLFMH